MHDIQIIHSPAGDELVVLPRADYDALLAASGATEEDADDVALFDQRMAALAAGTDQRLPAAVTAAMLRGASRLAALRKWRGINQITLAAAAGIGQGYLSDLESRRRAGSTATLGKLAEILDVPLVWLTD